MIDYKPGIPYSWSHLLQKSLHAPFDGFLSVWGIPISTINTVTRLLTKEHPRMTSTQAFTDPRVPCALKPYIHADASRKVLRSLSDHGNQLSFFNWVTHRTKDSDIEEDELKMCPLIWCRKTFETNELAVRHVFDCSRIWNAWYWCPFHRHPERFLECHQGCEIVPKPKIYRAVAFFNWLGRRRLLKRQARAECVEETLIEGDQDQDQGSENLTSSLSHELPEFDLSLSNWVAEKVGCPGHQSWIYEVYGGGDFPELTANPENAV